MKGGGGGAGAEEGGRVESNCRSSFVASENVKLPLILSLGSEHNTQQRMCQATETPYKQATMLLANCVAAESGMATSSERT